MHVMHANAKRVAPHSRNTCSFPVTYFVTYGTAMACYAYFVLTKQDYILPDVRDRQFLLSFHKKAKRDQWDIHRYKLLSDHSR